MSKFLSEQWANDVSAVMATHEGFKNAMGPADLAIQFNVSDAPDGEVAYYLAASGGVANMSVGTLDNPDITVDQSYETASAISKGDLNTQTAFMTGKLKVSGNLAKLMMHQAAVQQWAAAVSELDVEY